MKKVLIAVDYHPSSEKVVENGYQLAKSMNAEVQLMHVLADVSYYGMAYPPFMGYEGYDPMALDIETASEMRKVAEDFVKTAANHLDDPRVSIHITEGGDTAKAILKHAQEWNADLIVMGTHSHSALEKLFVGTVASSVLEKTEVPVYLVPVKK